MRRLLITALLLSISILASAVVPTASAHVQYSKGEWAFAGTTRTSENPGAEHKADPVTLIWRGGPPIYTRAVMEDHLQRDWNESYDLFPQAYRAPMTPVSGATCTALENQGMFFFSPFARRYDQGADLNYHAEAVRYCGLQWHIRLWDDVEHDEMVPPNDHTVNSWWVGTIHFERRDEDLGHRRIKYSFERGARRYLLAAYAWNHCTYSRWKYLPGSEGRTSAKLDYSDGKLSRINLNRGPHQGLEESKPCAGSPGH